MHYCFTRDALESILTLVDVADVELHSDTTCDAWNDLAVSMRLQTGKDLGARMLHALDAALAADRPRAMIVGSDAPTLPAGHLRDLLAADADVALGPSEDGGYYAISCRKVHPEMFRGVSWSVTSTLAETVKAVETCGLSVVTGRTWFDIDSPQDLQRLRRSANLPRHTRAWLASHGN